MQNVHATLRQFVAPFAPQPIEADALQAARAHAWAEVQQAEAADPSVLRALREQQQHLQMQGVLE